MEPRPRQPYIVGDEKVDRMIAELAACFGVPETEDLLRQILTTAVKLGSDGANRGDLKVINSSLKELRLSFRVFSPYRAVRKVIVFGSARTPEDDPLYAMAEEFGRQAVKAGFMVITGAGPGIMEAANKGAGLDNSFGVAIKLPFEQEVNPFIRPTSHLINFKYFFDRKLIFIKESEATVLFPGGFGTRDEGFENLTLIQTGRSWPRPVVFLEPPGGTYWDGWRAFVEKNLLAGGYISPEDLHISTYCSSPLDAVEVIKKFYRVYHSMRYVGPLTVFRVMKPIDERRLKELGTEFRDILTDGYLVNAVATEEEKESDEYPEHPRLAMKFIRKRFGRLYQLIDALNEL